LALIERLHVVLGKGLTVFSGETGAGKSIVLQAIALLTGARASSSWVRTGAAQAVVEATFDCPESPALHNELREMGLDEVDELLIKRVVSSDGKSRFYLNGGLTTARLVQSVSEHLVSVASQHDHQRLLNPKYHLDFIDMAGELWSNREMVTGFFDQWAEAKKELDLLRQREMDKEQRRDFLSYQLREIDAAAIEVGEDERLTRDRLRLKGSADLKKFGLKCYRELQSASESLGLARKNIDAIAAIDQDASVLAASVAEQSFLIDDYVGQIRDYLNRVPDDELALEEIVARITYLQQLKRKYGEDLADILAYAEKIREELHGLDELDQKIGLLAKECAAIESGLIRSADELSLARKEVAIRLGNAVRDELRALSFAQADFVAAFKESDKKLEMMTRAGWDRCE
ncbi:MAG: AAA family ATPase, partial [Desulfobulbaceae bacterium]|nr:AAA family ATPase [Desulfobulbaceae bacterium]